MKPNLKEAIDQRKTAGVALNDATPPAPRKIPGLKGQIPYTASAVVLTASEEKTLKALGWKQGDPIPSLLAEELSEIRDEQDKVQKDLSTAKLDPKSPKLKLPAEVDISQV